MVKVSVLNLVLDLGKNGTEIAAVKDSVVEN